MLMSTSGKIEVTFVFLRLGYLIQINCIQLHTFMCEFHDFIFLYVTQPSSKTLRIIVQENFESVEELEEKNDHKETLWTQHGSYIYKCIAVMILCTRPKHSQCRQNCIVDVNMHKMQVNVLKMYSTKFQNNLVKTLWRRWWRWWRRRKRRYKKKTEDR